MRSRTHELTALLIASPYYALVVIDMRSRTREHAHRETLNTSTQRMCLRTHESPASLIARTYTLVVIDMCPSTHESSALLIARPYTLVVIDMRSRTREHAHRETLNTSTQRHVLTHSRVAGLAHRKAIYATVSMGSAEGSGRVGRVGSRSSTCCSSRRSLSLPRSLRSSFEDTCLAGAPGLGVASGARVASYVPAPVVMQLRAITFRSPSLRSFSIRTRKCSRLGGQEGRERWGAWAAAAAAVCAAAAASVRAAAAAAARACPAARGALCSARGESAAVGWCAGCSTAREADGWEVGGHQWGESLQPDCLHRRGMRKAGSVLQGPCLQALEGVYFAGKRQAGG